jgi:hypothetical protein
MRRVVRGAVVVACVLGVGAGSVAWGAPKRSKRYGIEGKIVRYDEASDVLVVEVVKTKVSGGAGTGRVAGEEAPDAIERGSEVSFAVVPEGSVLRRTVVKSIQGGALNNAGTEESFVQALAAIPGDRPVIFSFEARKGGNPAWLLKMIQIRMTEEELEARLEEITAD